MSDIVLTANPSKDTSEHGGLPIFLSTNHKRGCVSCWLSKAHDYRAITLFNDLNFLHDSVYIYIARINIIKKLAVFLSLELPCSSYFPWLDNKLQTSKNSDKDAEQKGRPTLCNDGATEHKLDKQNNFIHSAMKNCVEFLKLKTVRNSVFKLENLLFGHPLFPFICSLWAAQVVPADRDDESHYLRT